MKTELKVISLEQALIFSKLSHVRVDGCTFAPELGVTVYCKMHDHVLIHLASKTHKMNRNQIDFLYKNQLSDTLSRYQSDILFYKGLAKKVEETNGLRSKGYWFVKWGYYYFVRARSIIFK